MDGQMSTFMLDAHAHTLASTWREREIHAEALQWGWGKGLHSSHQKVCKHLVGNCLDGNRPMSNCLCPICVHIYTTRWGLGPVDLLVCLWMITGAGVLRIAFIWGGVTAACRFCFCFLLLLVCTHHFLCFSTIIASLAVMCVMSVDHC